MKYFLCLCYAQFMMSVKNDNVDILDVRKRKRKQKEKQQKKIVKKPKGKPLKVNPDDPDLTSSGDERNIKEQTEPQEEVVQRPKRKEKEKLPEENENETQRLIKELNEFKQLLNAYEADADSEDEPKEPKRKKRKYSRRKPKGESESKTKELNGQAQVLPSPNQLVSSTPFRVGVRF